MGVVTAAVVVGVVTTVVAVVVVFGMISMLPDDLKRVNIILMLCLNQNMFEVIWPFLKIQQSYDIFFIDSKNPPPPPLPVSSNISQG